MDICGKICTKETRNDTKSSLKCHGNILFYTSTRHRNTSKYRISTMSMKRHEVTSLNDVSYRNDVNVFNKVVVAKTLFFSKKFKIRCDRIPRGYKIFNLFVNNMKFNLEDCDQ